MREEGGRKRREEGGRKRREEGGRREEGRGGRREGERFMLRVVEIQVVFATVGNHFRVMGSSPLLLV